MLGARVFAAMLALTSCRVDAAADEPDIQAESRPAVAHIRLSTPIDQYTASQLIQAIQEAVATNPRTLVLEINSPGGIVSSGFLVSKAIEDVPMPVVCIVDGDALSMAFYALQSCPTRVMTPRSRLMVHRAWKPMEGPQTITSLQNALNDLRTLARAMDAHWGRRLKMSVDAFRRFAAAGDGYLNADRALEIGAVDRIVPDVKTLLDELVPWKLPPLLPQSSDTPDGGH